MRTHYDNLHIKESASLEVIKAAYKALAQKWHPDKNPDQREKAERYFKIITAAFELLSNPESRANYDAWLKQQRSAAPQQPETESPQERHDENMTEAWEDGRRSREQGFTEKDCPYSGDFARAWQQGFKDSAPKRAQGKTAEGVSNYWLASLWRGDEGLGKTFWLYGVIGMFAVIVAACGFSVAIVNNRSDIQSIIRIAQNFYGIYFIFIAVCIWRAAGHTRPLSVWAISARALCLTPLYGVALAILIPMYSTPKKPVAGYAEQTGEPVQTAPKSAGEQMSSTSKPSPEEDAHYHKIYAAHPDADSIVMAQSFVEWTADNSEWKRILESGSSDEVITLISAYKAHLYSRRPTQSAATAPSAAASRNPYPNCVIYSVMTDEDYAACGITPP